MRRPTGAYARLVKACLRRGRTLEDAEDLVQEAYARLIEYQHSAKVRDEEAFLRRVVSNLAINQYHREQILSFAHETIDQLDRQSMLVDSGPGIERILSARAAARADRGHARRGQPPYRGGVSGASRRLQLRGDCLGAGHQHADGEEAHRRVPSRCWPAPRRMQPEAGAYERCGCAAGMCSSNHPTIRAA